MIFTRPFIDPNLYIPILCLTRKALQLLSLLLSFLFNLQDPLCSNFAFSNFIFTFKVNVICQADHIFSGSLSAKLFLNLAFWGPHSGWPKFFSVFCCFSLPSEGSHLWLYCLKKLFLEVLICYPSWKLAFLSKLAGVIFNLKSRQSWFFIWELPIWFQIHLWYYSQTIHFELRFKSLVFSNAKIGSVTSF